MAGKNVDGREVSAMRDHWEIQYSRFFEYPPRPRALHPHSSTWSLRPLPESRRNLSKGTWISSSPSSTSFLDLIYYNASQWTLIVSLQEKIYEEHFISKLHFSWPQVSCVQDCPVRGSRVVFASYKDSEGQASIHIVFGLLIDIILALPGPEVCNALFKRFRNRNFHAFFEGHVAAAGSNFELDILTQTEFTSQDVVQQSAEDDMDLVNPTWKDTTQMQTVRDHDVIQQSCSEITAVGHDYADMSSPLPPSFTVLLSNGAETEQEQPKPLEDIDIMAQLLSYLKGINDSSFCDTLNKIEKVIYELGGDLTI
ncbi:hypothetical protein RJ641_014330 [Dillenia turbinata]|uniref:Poor homologous synapsis 1 PH domain-containing protein n=1 Tax=Dillenia turbinata TaxID=194707 RepID=A0AAN8V482_9MAGN